MAAGSVEIVFTLLILYLSWSEAVRCYICDSVAHSEDCAHAGFCGSHQQCYTQRIIGDGLNDYFKVGCVDRDVCAKSQFSLFGTFSIGKRSISKRDDPMVTCLQCCDGDLCNKALCGAVKTNRRRCFECDDVDHPKDCESIVECGRDEQCYTHFGPRHSNWRYTYTMSCMSKLACDAFAGPGVFLSNGCTRCCNTSDYCNFQVCNGWTKPTTSQPLTTVQPGNSPGGVAGNSPVGVVTSGPTAPQTTPPMPVITGNTSALYTLDVRLSCNVQGSPLSIQWFYKQNDPLPPEVMSSGGVLNILNLNETRAGIYTCMAVSQSGAISMANVWVTIQDTPPIVISVIKNPPVVSLGQPFKIHCTVIGYPKPKVTWQFLGTDGSSTVPSQVHFSTDQKTLEVPHYSNLHHNGQWTCTASNYIGKSQVSVDVP